MRPNSSTASRRSRARRKSTDPHSGRDAGRDFRPRAGKSVPACATTTSPRWPNMRAGCSAASRACFSALGAARPGCALIDATCRRAAQPGEHFSLLIENSGPGGFYTEIARTMVLGKASNELIDGFESMKEAQAHTLRLLKPGASCADVAKATTTTCGRTACRRNCGSTPWPGLRPGRAAADPRRRDHDDRGEHELRRSSRLRDPSIFAVICDNYLIGPAARARACTRPPSRSSSCDGRSHGRRSGRAKI